jgi:hypothetical protein
MRCACVHALAACLESVAKDSGFWAASDTNTNNRDIAVRPPATRFGDMQALTCQRDDTKRVLMMNNKFQTSVTSDSTAWSTHGPLGTHEPTLLEFKLRGVSYSPSVKTVPGSGSSTAVCSVRYNCVTRGFVASSATDGIWLTFPT